MWQHQQTLRSEIEVFDATSVVIKIPIFGEPNQNPTSPYPFWISSGLLFLAGILSFILLKPVVESNIPVSTVPFLLIAGGLFTLLFSHAFQPVYEVITLDKECLILSKRTGNHNSHTRQIPRQDIQEITLHRYVQPRGGEDMAQLDIRTTGTNYLFGTALTTDEAYYLASVLHFHLTQK